MNRRSYNNRRSNNYDLNYQSKRNISNYINNLSLRRVQREERRLQSFFRNNFGMRSNNINSYQNNNRRIVNRVNRRVVRRNNLRGYNSNSNIRRTYNDNYQPRRIIFRKSIDARKNNRNRINPNFNSTKDTANRKVLINNLDVTFPINELKKIFGVYGKIERASIIAKKECGVVLFKTNKSANSAKNDLDSKFNNYNKIY